jgi:hypothetical protein
VDRLPASCFGKSMTAIQVAQKLNKHRLHSPHKRLNRLNQHHPINRPLPHNRRRLLHRRPHVHRRVSRAPIT